ncbi:MAG: aminotransferase class IV [Pseudomonadota bacterium]
MTQRIDSAASIAIDDRGFTLGDALFETLLVRDGKAVALHAHLRRLRRGFERLRYRNAPTSEALVDLIEAKLSASDLTHGSLRLTVSRGAAPRGLLPPADIEPTVVVQLIDAAPVPQHLALVVSEEVTLHANSALRGVKTTNYLEQTLALMAAKERGFDDVLLMNTDGRLVCASSAAVILRVDDELLTPAAGDGALVGTTLQHFIDLGLVNPRSLTRSDLKVASMAVLVTSLGIRSVRSCVVGNESVDFDRSDDDRVLRDAFDRIE